MTYWFLFTKGDIYLQRTSDGRWKLPQQEMLPFGNEKEVIELPLINSDRAKALEVADLTVVPSGYDRMGLRASFQCLDAEAYQWAGKAAELLHWHLSTLYCGHCGHPLRYTTPISKQCEHCGREIWPTLSPAIIVRITRGDEILLVQSNTFKRDYYGLIAGFVETGESLEECVRREVKEETGMEITKLRYFGSQPWPYPRGLMLGFTAQWKSGTLRLQREELRKGGWFHRDKMPAIPEKLSMARMLIDDWLGEK